ncbi:MAG: hypothetical protein KDA60_19800, partial [Planctomycetales bacterium]|nr:hypothetical protein [Planctomycetales bacterium]
MKTDQDALNRMIGELARNSQAFAATTAADRRDMVVELLKTVAAVTDDWVASGCRAKGAPSPIVAAEEIINGPAVTFRFLQLTRAALDDLAHGQKPRLPAAVITDEQGRVKVPILPAKGLFDPLNFLGFRAYARMLPEVTTENLMGYRAPQFAVEPQPGITLVLGAGNVSSIPLIDVLSKLFHEGQVVLLKVNPVNEYLGPIFERALAPLMARGFVRIAYGGGDVGASAINHPDISSVHITGSAESHDMIVWGPPGEERERRKRENSPLLRKPITSELGNVSPWIVVPGKYSARQLAFQAENIAASITNNVSFNCVATKLIVTNRDWPDRDRFLDLVDHFLRDTPRRKAYYPGAVERYRRFAGDRAATSECDEETLPWTL